MVYTQGQGWPQKQPRASVRLWPHCCFARPDACVDGEGSVISIPQECAGGDWPTW